MCLIKLPYTTHTAVCPKEHNGRLWTKPLEIYVGNSHTLCWSCVSKSLRNLSETEAVSTANLFITTNPRCHSLIHTSSNFCNEILLRKISFYKMLKSTRQQQIGASYLSFQDNLTFIWKVTRNVKVIFQYGNWMHVSWIWLLCSSMNETAIRWKCYGQ